MFKSIENVERLSFHEGAIFTKTKHVCPLFPVRELEGQHTRTYTHTYTHLHTHTHMYDRIAANRTENMSSLGWLKLCLPTSDNAY